MLRIMGMGCTLLLCDDPCLNTKRNEDIKLAVLTEVSTQYSNCCEVNDVVLAQTDIDIENQI